MRKYENCTIIFLNEDDLRKEYREMEQIKSKPRAEHFKISIEEFHACSIAIYTDKFGARNFIKNRFI
jgi:hypothetical protein